MKKKTRKIDASKFQAKNMRQTAMEVFLEMM